MEREEIDNLNFQRLQLEKREFESVDMRLRVGRHKAP